MTSLLSWFWVGLSVFSLQFMLKSPGSNMQKAGERYWKAEAASDHWCVSAEWQGVAWNEHFPPCVHHVWLFEVYRAQSNIIRVSRTSQGTVVIFEMYIVDNMRIIQNHKLHSQDTVASAVRKSTAEKVSGVLVKDDRGLERKDWGFETETSVMVDHNFFLGVQKELSSKHIRRVSQNSLMLTMCTDMH